MEGAVWYIKDRGAQLCQRGLGCKLYRAIATVSVIFFRTVARAHQPYHRDPAWWGGPAGSSACYKALGYSRARIQSSASSARQPRASPGRYRGRCAGLLALPYHLHHLQDHMRLAAVPVPLRSCGALLGVALFAVGIVGATFVACRQVLKETPASLMRPQGAPCRRAHPPGAHHPHLEAQDSSTR